jgi:adenylate kinase family enzyme
VCSSSYHPLPYLSLQEDIKKLTKCPKWSADNIQCTADIEVLQAHIHVGTLSNSCWGFFLDILIDCKKDNLVADVHLLHISEKSRFPLRKGKYRYQQVLSGLGYEHQKDTLSFSSLVLEIQISKEDRGTKNKIHVEICVDSSFGSTLLCARLLALVGKGIINIALVGTPGSGKSSIHQAISTDLQLKNESRAHQGTKECSLLSLAPDRDTSVIEDVSKLIVHDVSGWVVDGMEDVREENAGCDNPKLMDSPATVARSRILHSQLDNFHKALAQVAQKGIIQRLCYSNQNISTTVQIVNSRESQCIYIHGQILVMKMEEIVGLLGGFETVVELMHQKRSVLNSSVRGNLDILRDNPSSVMCITHGDEYMKSLTRRIEKYANLASQLFPFLTPCQGPHAYSLQHLKNETQEIEDGFLLSPEKGFLGAFRDAIENLMGSQVFFGNFRDLLGRPRMSFQMAAFQLIDSCIRKIAEHTRRNNSSVSQTAFAMQVRTDQQITEECLKWPTTEDSSNHFKYLLAYYSGDDIQQLFNHVTRAVFPELVFKANNNENRRFVWESFGNWASRSLASFEKKSFPDCNSEKLVLSHHEREVRSKKRLSDRDNHLQKRACIEDSSLENLREPPKDSDVHGSVIPPQIPQKR